jgi:hypothetical protein
MFDMPWRIVDIPLGSEGELKAWETLDRNSNIRRVLHNELVKRLHKRQADLETCVAEDLKGVQLIVQELKNFLEFLHKNESPSSRKTYE